MAFTDEGCAINADGEVETLSFYDGAVTLYFDPRLHVYYELIEGEKVVVTGTTDVTGKIDKSGPLTQWAANSTSELILNTFPASGEDRAALLDYYARIKTKVPILVEKDDLLTITAYDLAKLCNDARFNYRAISKEAKDIGHEAHYWLEGWIKAKLAGTTYDRALPEDPRAVNCIMAALKWIGVHEFEPLCSERKVYSRKYGVAGTLDWIARITTCGNPLCCGYRDSRRVTALGDFKSSKAIYPEYRCQLAMYDVAHTEEFPMARIDVRILLRLGKEDGEFETMPMLADSLPRDFSGFMGALVMVNYLDQMDMDVRLGKMAVRAAKKLEKERLKALTPVKGRVRRQVIKEIAEDKLIPIAV
jgi:hypothetical protein